MSESDGSSVFSIDGLADMVYSLPESIPETEADHVDEDNFDIDILLRKLQAYKDSLDEATSRSQRSERLSLRETQVSVTTPPFGRDADRPGGTSGQAGNLGSLPTLSSSSSTSGGGVSGSPETPDNRDVIQALKEATEQFREESGHRRRSRSFQGQGVVYGNVKAQRGALIIGSPKSLASPAFAPPEFGSGTLSSAPQSPTITTTDRPSLLHGPPANIVVSVHGHRIPKARPSPIWVPGDAQVKGNLEQYALRHGKWTDGSMKLDSSTAVDRNDNDRGKDAAPVNVQGEPPPDRAGRSVGKAKIQREKPMSFRDKVASFKFLRRRTKSENIIDMYLHF